MMTKCFILAGEKSGDLHAGNLVKALKVKDAKISFKGWGGSEMENAGVEILQHYSVLSYMGLDFLWSLREIRRVFATCKEQILTFNPDVLVLVDNSGFNMRIAKWAKKNGFTVVYYIAPKTWAWNSSRNRAIKKVVDKLLVILPFEKDYFSSRGIKTAYVGNPLTERIDDFNPDPIFRQSLPKECEKVVALLPGSRKGEIERMVGEMKLLAEKFSDVLFVVAGVSEINKSLYDGFIRISNCELVFDQTYDLLSIADAAIVTSGTATLETALFKVPQIVVYRTSALTYFIAKSMIKVKYISLVNLILDKMAVEELIQDKYSSHQLILSLRGLLKDTKIRNEQLESYDVLKTKIGTHKASEEAANEIYKMLR